MGVGISAKRLAGTVASQGALGTIASPDLRHLHPDLLERTRRASRPQVDEANLEALDREVRGAREICGREGFLAVNVMKAVRSHAGLVRQAVESGADAIVMGAGLPLDLPDIVGPKADVALIPIISEERSARAILQRWMRRDRLPDAFIVEHPGHAGGHLGASSIADVESPRFDFGRVLEEIRKVIDSLGIAVERIPLIAAGGVNTPAKLRELLSLGASAVQVGTPFAVTEESDAHPNFKKVLASARPEEIVTFQSAAGLPARAVLTPWLRRYLAREEALREKVCAASAGCVLTIDCLSHCGLKDANPRAGQFCIDSRLSAALRGNVENGLFFRGAGSLPFGEEIRSVRDLIAYFLPGFDAIDPLPA